MQARPDNAAQREGAGPPEQAGSFISSHSPSPAGPSEPLTGLSLIEPPSRELLGEMHEMPRLPEGGIREQYLPENRVLISDGRCRLAGVGPDLGGGNPGFCSDAGHPHDLDRVPAAYARLLERN
jgi:hypothetical protein